ncbi:hypothetical protein LOTGIDRAFT_123644 [Lottia gigantea]|uniref:Membrane insertase YidC/Oxa/ALB C-terminal domain-containing protein n=1 Tax=Lottia gigantea TaxID=225164 RepID=V4A0Z5_LOTGI|nr:hypothetical protein LOTGIDRAFT_123644 [Lottia gigantea]ESO90327.1 hypothetical protein LOTGIDRAFT_123644 [Lottia gigantea]
MVDVPYIPPPPKIPSDSLEIPESIVSETVNAVNALGEPTLQSLGLGSWSPVGMVQQLTEFLHISLDIPWWGAICLLTVCLRVLMFPIFIKSQINAVNLHNIMPEMTRHQARFTEAKRSQDMMTMAMAHKDLVDFMKESKFSPFMMMYPMLQAPVFISVYWGLRGMANAPVESMKEGGMLWFTDLTLSDPTALLPVICSGLLLATMEVGADGVRTESMTTSVRWLMRGLPIVFIPIMINFPSAVLCYWVTSNVISLALVSILKIPGVKPFFKIPERIRHPKQLKSTTVKVPMFKGIKENWENAKIQERMRKKDAMDSNIFKQAASGPIPKTYINDPTGGKATKTKESPNTWKMPWSKNKSD